MRSLTHGLVALVVFVTALATARTDVASGDAVSAWEPATFISGTTDVSDARVGMDAKGDAVVVWLAGLLSSRSSVVVAVHRSGGTRWSSARRIWRDAPGRLLDPNTVSLEVTPSGFACVVLS